MTNTMNPEWANAAQIQAAFGLGKSALAAGVAAGRIRKFKTGKAQQCAAVYNVADVRRWVGGDEPPTPPPPTADRRPEATDEDFAALMRRAAKRA